MQTQYSNQVSSSRQGLGRVIKFPASIVLQQSKTQR
jgi:hypothetical protein